METQSSVRQAGTTPAVLSKPRVWFQANQIVERCRHAARTRRISAEGKRYETLRHCHC